MKRLFIILCMSLFFFAGCGKIAPSGIIVNDLVNVNVTNEEIVVEDFSTAVAMGQIANTELWNKWGYNDDVDTSITETVWAAGGVLVELETGTVLNISSTSTDDDSAGIGARSVVIWGVNSTRDAVIDIVPLDGTNVVQSNLEFLGVNRMAIYAAGSNNMNVGEITAIGANQGGNTQAFMPTAQGTTQQAFYFVSDNHTFLADWLWIHGNKLSGGSTPKLTIKGFVKSYVSNATYEVFRTVLDTSTENTEELSPPEPFVIAENSLFYFTVDSDTNNAEAIVRFSGIEVRNNIG